MRFGVGAGLTVHGGVAPDAVLTFIADLSVELPRAGEWGFGFGISGQRSKSDPILTEVGEAELTFTMARAWTCPISFPGRGAYGIAPCAAFEFGALGARGFNTFQPAEPQSPWLAPGGFARAEIRPVRLLALVVDAGFVLPLIRENFYFDPGITAYQPPPLAGFGVLSLNLKVP